MILKDVFHEGIIISINIAGECRDTTKQSRVRPQWRRQCSGEHDGDQADAVETGPVCGVTRT